MIRRDFIKQTLMASSATMMPHFLKALNTNALTVEDRKLIIVQLSGGNDGLNTCIPYRNDIYYQSRPTLSINATDVLRLTDDLGLHPSLTTLRELYDAGELTLINQVGYPNADRSHFRAMDIWHTASNADEYWQTGWLGRYLDHTCQGCASPLKVIETDETLSLAVKGNQTKALALKDPKRLYRQTQSATIQQLYTASDPTKIAGNDNLQYMYKTLVETVNSTEYIHQTAQTASSGATYPKTDLGRQLRLIGELIGSGIETRVYYASISGFDTHVRQKIQHERLLIQLNEALAVLVKDLKRTQHWEHTLIMVFSEFGRRVSQNASAGTDHGKANNVWMIGGQLKKSGIYNTVPDLTGLAEGDLPHKVDFRSIYATLLRNWLDADDENILNRKYELLDFV